MIRRQRTVIARDDDGAIAVEFSLLVPIALLFIGFLMTLALRTLWAGLAEDAARSLARYGSIRTTTGDYPNRPALVTRSTKLLGGILGTATINMSQIQSSAITYDQDSSTTTGVGEGDLLTVSVSYRVPGVSALADLVSRLPVVGLDLSGLATVTGSSTARRE